MINTAIFEQIAAGCLASIGCWVPLLVMALIGILVRRNAATRYDAELPDLAPVCGVCGRIRKPEHVKQCMDCGQYFCYHAATSNARSSLDNMVRPWALGLGCLLTAFTILGGVITLAVLAIPYFIFRAFLPGKNARACGGRVYGPIGADVRTTLLGDRCNNCGGELAAAYGVSPTVSTYEDSTSSAKDAYDDAFHDQLAYDEWQRMRDDRSDDDDGSVWDGWLVKWK